ncbi:MAG: ABC transporter substrate-binding protein [Proteobacteria bacterium]|nr:ABC transporter substrate-binding protein [Pseudomonadota bacterium]
MLHVTCPIKATGLLTLAVFFSTMVGTLAVSAEKPTLTVVAAYNGKGEIFTEFHKKTGILIDFLDMSSGEVLARAEPEGGKPMADVWFGGGADSFIKAREMGLLDAYRSPEAQTVPTQYKDPDGYWTGVSLVMAGFLVNTDVLAEKNLPVPQFWADLITAEYKDAVLVADPAISATTFTVLACLLQKLGAEEGWKYFEALGKNVAFFTKSSSDPQKRVVAGQMAVSIVPLSKELITLKEKSPVQAVFPKDGIPWMPSAVAIFKNARNPVAAKAFVDWVLSVEGQRIIQGKDPRIMVRPEIAIPKEMDGVVLADLISADIVKIGAERQQILATWAQRVTGKQ